MNVSGLGPAQQVDGLAVTAGFFDALAIRPLLGRAIVAADERIRPPRVVVLGYGFWQQHYGGARDVIGRSIDVNELAGVWGRCERFRVCFFQAVAAETPVHFPGE